MKVLLTLIILFLLQFKLLVGQSVSFESHWNKLKSSPTKSDIVVIINEAESFARQNNGIVNNELENLLNYAGNIASFKLHEFRLAAQCYEILYDYKLSSNPSLSLLIATNIISELERIETMDIHLYEDRLKIASKHLNDYLINHPDDFTAYYNLGALYYNYIAYIQDHKIYDFDKNINAAVNSKNNLVKALKIQPNNDEVKDLLHSVNLILGQDSGHTDINFNEGK